MAKDTKERKRTGKPEERRGATPGRSGGREPDGDMAQGTGAGANVNPGAPASSGLVHGGPGTVVTTGDPDHQPRDTAGTRVPEPGKGESAVPSPSGGTRSARSVQSGSAAAASASAGGASPDEAEPAAEAREVAEEDDEH